MMPATPVPDHNICAEVYRPTVTPLCVFAPGRKSFTVIVRGQDWLHGVQPARFHARGAIFSALPLEKHGWDRTTAQLALVKRTAGDEAIWKLSRGDT
jgi:hypothetical protein